MQYNTVERTLTPLYLELVAARAFLVGDQPKLTRHLGAPALVQMNQTSSVSKK